MINIWWWLPKWILWLTFQLDYFLPNSPRGIFILYCAVYFNSSKNLIDMHTAKLNWMKTWLIDLPLKKYHQAAKNWDLWVPFRELEWETKVNCKKQYLLYSGFPFFLSGSAANLKVLVNHRVSFSFFHNILLASCPMPIPGISTGEISKAQN